MSSGSEANYDLGFNVNYNATQALLSKLRHTTPGVRVIYASSQAVYGRPFPDVITEEVFPTPEGSYGSEKLMCELLINDMTRRGFINGFSLRFPTISVRPGKPSQAASSFISGVIREPLAGKECIIPIEDRSFKRWLLPVWLHWEKLTGDSWVCSPRTLINNLIHALSLPSDALPSHKRTVNAPGLLVTNQDMLDALERVAGKEALKLVKEVDDPPVSAILRSWAFNFDNSLAYSLGYQKDTSFETAVREYVDWTAEQEQLNGAWNSNEPIDRENIKYLL